MNLTEEEYLRFTILVAYALFLAACSSIPAASPATLPASTPVSTLALAPTLATEPTSTPSPTAMSTTPPPTATVLMPVPDGMSSLCENAFYPAPVGAQWQYRVTLSDGGADTYTKEIRDLADNSFTEHRTYADTSADHQWTCTSDGLVSKEFANLHIHGLTQYRFTTTRFSGITLPPPDQWQIGTVWSNSYDVNGEITQNGTTTSGTGVVEHQIRAAPVFFSRATIWRRFFS